MNEQARPDGCHEGFRELGVHAPTSDALAEALYNAEGFHAADSWATETAITRGRYECQADAARAHIAEVLADPETVEAVVEAMDDVQQQFGVRTSFHDMARAARAALAARLGVTL